MRLRYIAYIVLAAFTAVPASAAPPTVVPSPGYDARLQEQRAASSAATSEQVAKQAAPRHHRQRRIRH